MQVEFQKALEQLLRDAGFYPARPAVEIIDNRRYEAGLQAAQERFKRRRVRVIDVEPVAVIDLGSRPIVRSRAKPNPRRRRSHR